MESFKMLTLYVLRDYHFSFTPTFFQESNYDVNQGVFRTENEAGLG